MHSVAHECSQFKLFARAAYGGAALRLTPREWPWDNHLLRPAGVAELADAPDSKSGAPKEREGSTPSSSTNRIRPSFHTSIKAHEVTAPSRQQQTRALSRRYCAAHACRAEVPFGIRANWYNIGPILTGARRQRHPEREVAHMLRRTFSILALSFAIALLCRPLAAQETPPTLAI